MYVQAHNFHNQWSAEIHLVSWNHFFLTLGSSINCTNASKFCLKPTKSKDECSSPAGTWHESNIEPTLMQCHDIASTLMQHCINIMCRLGSLCRPGTTFVVPAGYLCYSYVQSDTSHCWMHMTSSRLSMLQLVCVFYIKNNKSDRKETTYKTNIKRHETVYLHVHKYMKFFYIENYIQ